MAGIAKVVVEIALDREFEYEIPAAVRDSVFLGSRVLVPFGKTKRTGYVVGLSDRAEHLGALKSIISVVGTKSLIDDSVLKLARWIAEYYCAPIEHAVRAVLPGAVRRGGARFRERLFVSPLKETCDPQALEALKKRSPKQAAALEMLRSEGGMFMADLAKSAGVSAAIVRALAKKQLVGIATRAESRVPFAGHTVLPTRPLKLMPEQESALRIVCKSIETLEPPVVLLHGVTGSGKTEVYLQAIAHVLEKGGGAIVLVPEISLTPQTVERFLGRFGENIAVLHSHLSEGERHDEWHRIRDGKARIAIGARSAVFAPVRNLGLIVVDEEHDTSYKQGESPRYNARDVAVMRGRVEQCPVLLGSATPSAESYANAQSGKYGMAVLPHRADNRKMPVMRIVDMRVETEREGRVNVFSRDLVEAIRTRLDRAEQTILFLNRRGYATSLICPKCGYVAKCNLCSIAFTYHRPACPPNRREGAGSPARPHQGHAGGGLEDLRCHICGAVRKMPSRCPNCSDPAFKFAGMGTQRVESVVRKLFPNAGIQRMDSDVTTRKDSHRKILGDFRTGKIDILIGTQMIAKGLDFPNVTLIGVIYADLSLHMPDFRAGERTFQLLTQVAGRAGRGDVPGEVIVQTFTPFHVAVQAARRLDYESFYDQEAGFRKELSYPPFSHLVLITVKGLSGNTVAFATEAFVKSLKRGLPRQVILSGPAPAPLAKAKGYYRYQVMLRSRSVKAMVGAVKETLKDFKWPPKVACSVDVDAISLM